MTLAIMPIDFISLETASITMKWLGSRLHMICTCLVYTGLKLFPWSSPVMVPRWISVRLDRPSTWHHAWTCERRDDKDDKKKYLSTATGRRGSLELAVTP